MFTEIEIRNITAPLAQARTLPPSAYTSDQVFEAEKANIFYKEWICVARLDQMPNPGDYLAADVVDQPILVVRLNDGGIHAMSAICPHRAMPVAQEAGNTSQFQCPYHLWKFDLEGKLISAPHMDGVEGFPSESCNLRPLKVQIWEGFIFVNLDAQANPLDLTGLDELVGEYKMGDMVIMGTAEFDSPWNWKILIENFMEAYHHIGPHLASLQSDYHAKDSYSSGSIEHGWSVLYMPESPKKAQEEELLPVIEGLTDQQRAQVTACAVLPTLGFINSPSMAFWYQLIPAAADKMLLKIHTLLPRDLAENDEGSEIGQLLDAAIQGIHLEDIEANEGPWKGQQAPMTQQGHLSLLEESIWQINQWWLKRVTKI